MSRFPESKAGPNTKVPSRDDIAAQVRAEHDLAARDVTARFSRGNVNLQLGAFRTKADVEKDLAKKL